MKGKLLLIIALPVLVYVGAKLYLHIQVGKSVDTTLAAMAPYADVTYDTVESTMDGSIGIRELAIKPHDVEDEVLIDHVSIKFPSMMYLLTLESKVEKQEFPTELRIAMDGITVDVNGELMSSLEQTMYADDHDAKMAAFDNCVTRTSKLPTQQYLLGYTKLDLSYAMGYRYEQDKGSIVLFSEFSQADGMEVKFEFGTPMSGLTLFGLQDIATDPQLVSASLAVKDTGYLERIYGYCEKENKLDKSTVTDMLMADFQDYFKESPMKPDDRILKDYRQFLSQGGEFVMQAKPRAPQKLGDLALYDPMDVPDLLNIHTIAR